MRPGDDLSEAELEVLAALWDVRRATVRQVLNRLHAGGRRVAYTTVLTFLTRLEQKGYVTSDRSELAYVYKPSITRSRVVKSRLKSMLETFYDGAAGALVLQLVRERRLSPDEISELQRLIERLDDSGSSERKKS